MCSLSLVLVLIHLDAVDCGGGGISGGCRLLQVLLSVLTCRLEKICTCT